MKLKDVKKPPRLGGIISRDATVGDLMEFLKQFPSDMPLLMGNSISGTVNPYFTAYGGWASFEEWETATISDNQVEGELEVKSVVIVA